MKYTRPSILSEFLFKDIYATTSGMKTSKTKDVMDSVSNAIAKVLIVDIRKYNIFPGNAPLIYFSLQNRKVNTILIMTANINILKAFLYVPRPLTKYSVTESLTFSPIYRAESTKHIKKAITPYGNTFTHSLAVISATEKPSYINRSLFSILCTAYRRTTIK